MTPVTYATEPYADDPPYGEETWWGALLTTVFLPFIALLLALILRGGESRPTRRGFLKKWALWSVAWLAVWWIVGLMIFLSVMSNHAGCTDYEHAVQPYSCADSQGPSVVPTPEVPGAPVP